MAAPIGTLAVRLAADIDKFQKDLARATRSLSKIGRAAGSVAKKSAVAFAGFSTAIGLVTKAASEQIAAEQQLASAFKASGNALDIEKFKAFASQLQSTTLYGDETTIALGAMLARFGLTQDQLQTLIPTIQDMSTALGIGLEASAQAVARSLNGQIGALSRYGVVLTDAEKEILKTGTAMEKTAVLAASLGSRFDGAASTATRTASGAFKQLTNSLGDVAEDIGKVLDKPLAEMFDRLRGVVESMPGPLKVFAAGFLAVGAAVSGFVTQFGLLFAAVPNMIIAFKSIGMAATTIIPAMLPLLGVFAAIAAAIAGVVITVGALKKAWDSNLFGMRDTLTTVGNWITKAWGDITDYFVRKWRAAVETVTKIWSSVKGMFGKSDVATPTIAAAGAISAPSLQEATQAAAKKAASALGFLRESAGEGVAVFGQMFSVLGDALGVTDLFASTVEDASMELDGLVPEISAATSKGGATTTGGSKPAKKEAGTAEEVSSNAAKAAESFGNTMLDASGEFGSVVNSTIAGFQAAGPWGAIAGLLAGLVSKSTAFQAMSEKANEALGELVEAINPLVEAVWPVVSIAITLLRAMGEFLPTALLVLTPAMEAFGFVLSKISTVILYIVRGIGWAWNAVVGAVSGLLRYLSNIEVFGKRPFAALSQWADAVDESMVSLSALDDRINDLSSGTSDLYDGSEDAGDGLDSFAESARAATQEILNAPQGFKIAAARFGATIGEPLALRDGGAAGGATGGGELQSPINIGQIVVNADDPVELARELQRINEYEAFRLTGSPISGMPSPVKGIAG